MRRLLGSARLTIAVPLLVLALAGCGGDDESEDDAARTGADSAAQTESTPRNDAYTSAATSTSETDRRGDGEDGEKRQERRPGADDSDPGRTADEPKAGRNGSGDGGRVDTTTRRQALKGKALRRCLARSVRQTGDRRLRTQARCLGTTAARLRRLIRAQCRRATNSPAAERNCIRIATGQ